MTSVLHVNGHDLPLDKDGYLKNLSDWNRDTAIALAQAANIELNEQHWAVIDVLRAFYTEHHISPATRVLVKTVARKLGTDQGNSAYLMQLFPSSQSPALVIAKIAGLPRPTNCL